MFVWPMAAIAPNNIEAIDKKTIIICHWSNKFKNGTYKNLINTVNAAIFGTIVKNNVTVLNTPGTIDSDYRGEIKVVIFNHGNLDFNINNGDRIAQMILSPVIKMDLEEVNDLPETIRGEGGFGSTGKWI